MKIDFERAVALLKEKDNIVILTHASPDGDTIGGGYALMLALQKLGKKARVINNDKIPEKFFRIINNEQSVAFSEKYVVSVDVADSKLLGSVVQAQYGDRIDLAIDHHQSNTLFAKETYLEGDSASACEVVYLLIEALGVETDREIADCLFMGMSTDTGCFRYSSVTPRTHRLAAQLIESGAQHAKINTLMFETKKLGFFRLQAACLEKMEMYFSGKVAVMTVTRKMLEETGCEDSDLDAIAALSRQVEGVKVGVTVKEKPDGQFKVSVRTDEDVDASKICAHFGGGGHVRAAGCTFGSSLEKSKEELLKMIENMI